MPKYKYPLSNGKHLVIDSDTEPDDDYLESEAKRQGVTLRPASDTFEQEKPVDLSIPSHLRAEPEKPGPAAPEKDNRSTVRKGWDAINKPLTDFLPPEYQPGNVGRSVSDWITKPDKDSTGSEWDRRKAQLKGFYGGTWEGAGDVIAGLTSPLNVVTAAASGGTSLAAKAGLTNVARVARATEAIGGGAMVLHGGSEVVRPDAEPYERLMGGIEAVLGAGAARSGIKGPHVNKPKPAAVAERTPYEPPPPKGSSPEVIKAWEERRDLINEENINKANIENAARQDLDYQEGKRTPPPPPGAIGEVRPYAPDTSGTPFGPQQSPAALSDIAAKARGSRIAASLPEEQPFGGPKPRITAQQAAENLRSGRGMTAQQAVDPNFMGGEGDPMLAGSAIAPRGDVSPEMRARMQQSPEQFGEQVAPNENILAPRGNEGFAEIGRAPGPVVDPNKPLNWKTDPQRSNMLRKEYQAHRTEEIAAGREPLSPEDFVKNRRQGPSEVNDLMDDFMGSQRKGPVPAGEPYYGPDGEIIGYTTDKDGSTGIEPVKHDFGETIPDESGTANDYQQDPFSNQIDQEHNRLGRAFPGFRTLPVDTTTGAPLNHQGVNPRMSMKGTFTDESNPSIRTEVLRGLEPNLENAGVFDKMVPIRTSEYGSIYGMKTLSENRVYQRGLEARLETLPADSPEAAALVRQIEELPHNRQLQEEGIAHDDPNERRIEDRGAPIGTPNRRLGILGDERLMQEKFGGRSTTPDPRDFAHQVDQGVDFAPKSPFEETVTDFDPSAKRRAQIQREMNPELAQDNFQQLDQELEYAKRRGSADEIEAIGSLRDEALDKYQQLTGKRILPANDDWMGPAESWQDDPYKNKGRHPGFGQPVEPTQFKGGRPVEKEFTPREGSIAARHRATIKEMDARGASDRQFRDVLYPEGTTARLKKGETWRGKVMDSIAKDIENQRLGNVDKMAEAMTPEGNIIIGYGKGVGKMLARALYPGNTAKNALKELLQNAIDNVRPMGARGGIDVTMAKGNEQYPDQLLRVQDNGTGLTHAELHTIFTNLGETGKSGNIDASGKFGIGKGAALLGGDFVKVETIVDEPVPFRVGKEILPPGRYKHIFEGDPEQLSAGTKPVRVLKVPEDTATGSIIETTIPGDQTFEEASDFFKKFAEHSADIGSKVRFHEKGGPKDRGTSSMHDITGGPNRKRIATFTDRTLRLDVYPSADSYLAETQKVKIRLINNGLYQGETEIYLHGKGEIPNAMTVDVKALVPQTDTTYPWTLDREGVDNDTHYKIRRLVQKEFLDPILEKARKELLDIYDKMPHVKLPNGHKFFLYDPDSKMTGPEMQQFLKDPHTQKIAMQVGDHVKVLLQRIGKQDWIDRIERVGFTFKDSGEMDGGYGLGVWIPNNDTGKVTLAFNPLGMMLRHPPDNMLPTYSHTLVHEIAHTAPFYGEDAHGKTHNYMMGELTTTIGRRIRNAIEDELELIVTRSGDRERYSPEIQDLLHRYQETRRRPAGTESNVSGVEAQQEVQLGPEGARENAENPAINQQGAGNSDFVDQVMGEEGIDFANDRPEEMPREVSVHPSAAEAMDISDPAVPNKDSVVIPSGQHSNAVVTQLRQKGYKFAGQDAKGDSVFHKSDDPVPVSTNAVPILRRLKQINHPEAGLVREIWNAPRTMMSVDLPFITSAALRQGLPLIGTKAWREAWGPSMKSYGSKAFYDAHQALIAADPLMQRGSRPVLNSQGKQLVQRGRPVMKEMPSIMEQAGVTLNDLSSFSQREEVIRASLPEKWGAYGKMVQANNRAYSAFINDLRISTFRNFYEAMPDKHDIVALKQIGDAVGTFTGRGPLRTEIPFTTDPKTGGRRVADLDRYAGAMAEVLFAPRLIASRMQMLNPVNYTMMKPQVRMEYLKAFTRTATAWTTMAAAGHYMGASINLNPLSADFGKIRIGNLRLDPAGGIQQYLVLAARVAANKFTSSTTNRTFDLGQGFGANTRKDVLENFVVNKFQPYIKYFYDMWNASDRKPFNVLDRTLQLAVPMMASDMLEVAQKEPELLPWLAPLVSAGVGSQYYEKGDPFGKSKFLAPALGMLGVRHPEKWDITLGR